MATSGTTSFTQTRNQIIIGAFRKIGAYAQGETPDATSVSEAATALNAMVKHWETSGIHLWTETEGTLWLQPNQVAYGLGANPKTIGPGGGSATNSSLSAGYTETTTTAAALAGATQIVLTSTTGFTAGVNVGVMLSNNVLQWTTQVGAASGSTITLAAALTGAVSSAAVVFAYTTALERPLRIVGARRIAWNAQVPNQIETPLNPMLSRLDYRNLPNKYATGVPTQGFYDPQLGTGVFYIWPAPQDSSSGMNLTFYRTIQDFDTAVNTPDLPQEWIRTLIWNLALEMAPEYDCPPARFQMIQTMAAQSLEEVEGWDREPESSFFGVALDQRSGI